MDADGSGGVDIEEARKMCVKFMKKRYPDLNWDEEKFRKGFWSLDSDKGG